MGGSSFTITFPLTPSERSLPFPRIILHGMFCSSCLLIHRPSIYTRLNSWNGISNEIQIFIVVNIAIFKYYFIELNKAKVVPSEFYIGWSTLVQKAFPGMFTWNRILILWLASEQTLPHGCFGTNRWSFLQETTSSRIIVSALVLMKVLPPFKFLQKGVLMPTWLKYLLGKCTRLSQSWNQDWPTNSKETNEL